MIMKHTLFTLFALCCIGTLSAQEDMSPSEIYERSLTPNINLKGLHWGHRGGWPHFKHRKYCVKMLPYYTEAAEHGEPRAQYMMGRFCHYGHEVERDCAAAVEWYRKAAGKIAAAKSHLGSCYEEGAGVEKDVTKAVALYRAAADEGDVFGTFRLAQCYAQGAGVGQDANRALEMLLSIDGKKFPYAQYVIGTYYETGTGVECDIDLAMTWYRRAAENGCVTAYVKLGTLLYDGDKVPQNYAEAVDWLEKAADEGRASAYARLADAYFCGHGVERNLKEAENWGSGAIFHDSAPDPKWLKTVKRQYADICLYNRIKDIRPFSPQTWQPRMTTLEEDMQKAAEGDVDAQLRMAFRYYDTVGEENNIEKAIAQFMKTAESGYDEAEYRLGIIYRIQRKTRDYAKALVWYERAARRGHIEAQIDLAGMYQRGEGTECDMAKAAYWLEKAAEQGSASACRQIGRFYELGEGVEKNEEKAREWYRRGSKERDNILRHHYKIIS